MNKDQILELLGPFIRGEVPKDERWHEARIKIGDSISDDDINDAIKILRTMIHNPFDPNPLPEPEVPGAHGVYSRLLWRNEQKYNSKEKD